MFILIILKSGGPSGGLSHVWHVQACIKGNLVEHNLMVQRLMDGGSIQSEAEQVIAVEKIVEIELNS